MFRDTCRGISVISCVMLRCFASADIPAGVAVVCACTNPPSPLMSCKRPVYVPDPLSEAPPTPPPLTGRAMSGHPLRKALSLSVVMAVFRSGASLSRAVFCPQPMNARATKCTSQGHAAAGFYGLFPEDFMALWSCSKLMESLNGPVGQAWQLGSSGLLE